MSTGASHKSPPSVRSLVGLVGCYHHHSVTPLKIEPTLVTETSEVKTQTPRKFPEESTLESQRGENLKTYVLCNVVCWMYFVMLFVGCIV
jgi:hypothetical protein